MGPPAAAIDELVQDPEAVFLRSISLPKGWKLRDHDMAKKTIEIENHLGQVQVLKGKHRILAVCPTCKTEALFESNTQIGNCNACGDPLECVWGTAQLVFVPEKEARFSSVPPSAGNGHKP